MLTGDGTALTVIRRSIDARSMGVGANPSSLLRSYGLVSDLVESGQTMAERANLDVPNKSQCHVAP